MTDNVDNLILELLEWLRPGSRPYSEVLEAWRTSCPRLPVWEEANERGYIERNGGCSQHHIGIVYSRVLLNAQKQVH